MRYDLDATRPGRAEAHLRAHPVDALISSLPYYCNVGVAEAARQTGCHYFDLTEDVAVTRAVRASPTAPTTAFVPQCGLAPGFISIAANALIGHFEELRSVKLRVGALPQHPNNVLKYSLTWSTEGLINEYGNPCEAIFDGRAMDVAPLEGLEEIEIDGTPYEAFNTSGGLGSLGDTFGSRAQSHGLQDDPLPRSLRADAPADERPQAEPRPRDAEADPRECRAADAAGRRDRLRRRDGPPGGRAARGELRQQDLSAGDRRPALVGDPGDDRRRHHAPWWISC